MMDRGGTYVDLPEDDGLVTAGGSEPLAVVGELEAPDLVRVVPEDVRSHGREHGGVARAVGEERDVRVDSVERAQRALVLLGLLEERREAPLGDHHRR